MPKDDAIDLLEAVAVTAELTGTELSKIAARVMADDLAGYPVAQVLDALTRCRRELKGKLTIAAVIERIDDGRPGPEEAWAMIPIAEAQTAVLNEEMSQAIPYDLIERGDTIAARMAFVETYRRLVTAARAARVPVRWFASLGHDVQGREAPLRAAERLGRLPAPQVAMLLPPPDHEIKDKRVALAIRAAGIGRPS